MLELLNELKANGTDVSAIEAKFQELQSQNESLKNELNKAGEPTSELIKLKGEINALKSSFGLKSDDITTELKSLIESKGKSDSAKLNALELQLSELNAQMKAEKAAKLELQKINTINKMIEQIPNLNNDFKDDIALRFKSDLKNDENGAIYFEKGGQRISEGAYLAEFIKTASKYQNARGGAGLNSANYDSTNQAINKSSFDKMTATQKLELYKKDPNLYKELMGG